MANLTRYEKAVKAIPRAMNVESRARFSNCSICMPNKLAAKVRGTKKKANSVNFVTAWASAMDRRLSSRAIFEVRDEDAV